ncbi:recombinase family protein [Paenibacillus sacheonensis]|uniref:Recombinase family protein n=1 Tax=Paenibacillus sacheonensis TaxID=742054 RepID=A0A7X4YP59_9BACL|nr:recombinase family protein [Paenibacillus sacheonensis]MBM7565270.1 DNA invertase Pin-like site-specific DNA recombinase [Paenibacillus sacheonensis]NBC69958.1 recombinase family protein [Paenibacillus sacheonensis]
MSKHVAIFNRKSRSEGDTDETMQNHRQITRRLCEERGFTYIEYEEVISGASALEERTELIRMLQDVEKGLFQAVVTVELSRLSRSGHYSHIIADTLAEHNVLIITPRETIDLNIDSQRFLYDIGSAVNSNEYRTIKRRMRQGIIEKAKRGEYVAGKVPFGYDAVIIGKKRTLVPNDDADIVRVIYNLAENGYGNKEIAKRMGKAHKSIENILRNKQYTGTLVYQLYNKPRTKGGIITDVIEVPNAFEAIVPMETHFRVQAAMKGRLRGDIDVKARSRGEVRTILKDLLYCNVCNIKTGFNLDRGRMYIKACPKCRAKGAQESVVLEAFYSQLEFVEKHWRELWEKALDKSSSAIGDDLTVQMETLEQSRSKLTNKLKKAREAYTEGIFTKEEYLTDKAAIDKELISIDQTLKQVKDEIEKRDLFTDSDMLEHRLTVLEKVKKLTNLTEINRLLKLIIALVYYQRNEDDSIELMIAPK